MSDQHPILTLLREEADVKVRLTIDAQISHFGEFSVAEGGGVLRGDVHCHRYSFYENSEPRQTGQALITFRPNSVRRSATSLAMLTLTSGPSMKILPDSPVSTITGD